MSIIRIKNDGYMTKILDHLYLGDIESSQNKSLLINNDIQFIINISNDNNYIKYNDLSIQYYDIKIDDNTSVTISDYFEQCINIIDNCRLNNKNILVHCMNGVSRSVCVIFSYLIHVNYKLYDALRYVKELRNKQYTQPNIGFFKQLMVFEKKYFNENSITLNQYVKSIKSN